MSIYKKYGIIQKIQAIIYIKGVIIMKRILHISDFHITSDMPEPQDNPRITKLIQKIKISFKKIHVLVFTGDLIDSRSISESIEKLPASEKEQGWNREAKIAFELGEKYLTYIKNELGLSDNEIILCVGNHDVNRNCVEKENLTCHKKEAFTFSNRFEAYKSFSDTFLPFKDSYKTYFRTIDDLNFLVVNSNWNNENKSRLCINCNDISIVLKNNISKLNENKNFNIFVSHSPMSDFCEDARYEYSDNLYDPIQNRINRYFNIFLAGDKHTQTFNPQELIAGSPLNSSNVCYGIYEFSNNNYCFKHLIYSNSEWSIETDSKSIQDIYAISKKYLKLSGMEVLYKINHIDDKVIFSQKYKGSIDQWNHFNKLFLSYTTLKKTAIGTSGIKVPVEGNLISTISMIIQDSMNSYPLVLRGMAKSGKSLFLTLLYLHLLEMYAANEFSYIPIYFNLDSITCDLDEKGWKYIENSIDDIFLSSKNLSLQYNMPICYILDGLCKNKYYDNCIEDYIQVKIESSMTGAASKDKFVVCLDTDDDLHMTNTDINSSIQADNILYFNSITINKINAKPDLENFIDAFTHLYSDSDNKTILNNIKKLNIRNIDLHTLISFKDYFLSDNNAQCTIADLYESNALVQFQKQNIDNACLACYKLYYENKTYDEIIKDGCKISYSIFEKIKKQKNLATFLIARCYVTAIELYHDHPKNRPSPILNECFNHEISNTIKELFLKNSTEKLNSLNANFYRKFNFQGIAMITYFMGRTLNNTQKLNKVLEQQMDYVNNRNPKNTEDEFYKKVAQRSIIISKISGLPNYKEHEEEYINNLLSNPKIRYVNREFYLLYYGDRKSSELLYNYTDTLYEGFDFYNVYHVLATKLEGWRTKKTESKLLRLEIFTLCDLIQQRIDNKIAISRNNRTSETKYLSSFFYDCRFTDKAKKVLEYAISIIKFYLSNDSSESLFTSYLKVKKFEFENFISTFENNKVSCESTGYKTFKLMEECSKISSTEKIGWKIPNVINYLNDDAYENYSKNKNYENVANHMYECYLIGLFYLPNDKPGDQVYNKQEILNILLIHDIGESIVNDYPPFYAKIDEKRYQEDMENRKIFLSGLHDGIADLTPQLKLWDLWYNETNINVRIAKEIDKIQMIHKMFVLLTTTDIQLSEERIKNILRDKEKIQTNYGKEIYNILITQNDNIPDQYKRLL